MALGIIGKFLKSREAEKALLEKAKQRDNQKAKRDMFYAQIVGICCKQNINGHDIKTCWDVEIKEGRPNLYFYIIHKDVVVYKANSCYLGRESFEELEVACKDYDRFEAEYLKNKARGYYRPQGYEGRSLEDMVREYGSDILNAAKCVYTSCPYADELLSVDPRYLL